MRNVLLLMVHYTSPAALFNNIAHEYQEKFMDVSLYREALNYFSNMLPERASVLDVACGPGNITHYLLGMKPDLNILGIDLSENMIALAKQNNPTAEFKVMDCRQIATLHKNYDAVVCAFCLPYLPKEEATQLVKDAVALTKDDGVLYLSTIEDDYSNSGPQKNSKGDIVDTYFYDEQYLSQVLQKEGCIIIYKDRQKSSSGGKEVIDLILIAHNINI
jgi:2-polyprenyl-3-methyl-5-hydroxy-6-metoxy-1,4-benzoquinol methylase